MGDTEVLGKSQERGEILGIYSHRYLVNLSVAEQMCLEALKPLAFNLATSYLLLFLAFLSPGLAGSVFNLLMSFL